MTTAADLTGRTFGRWTVLALAPRRPGRKPAYRCVCLCGETKIVEGDRLRRGWSKSCGCWMREQASAQRPWARRDLTGQRVGDLLVLRMGPNVPSTSPLHPTGWTAWICRCRCGREVLISTHSLTCPRRTRHCGCRHLKPALTPAPDAHRPRSSTSPPPSRTSSSVSARQNNGSNAFTTNTPRSGG